MENENEKNEIVDQDDPVLIVEDEDAGYSLFASADGQLIWWVNGDSSKRAPVFCKWLALVDGQRQLVTERCWRLVDLMRACPKYDFADVPDSPSIEDIREAYTAGRILRDPRGDLRRIYCYISSRKPDLYVGVAVDDKNNLILEHRALKEKSVPLGLGIGTGCGHDRYDARYGRGRWEIVWLESPADHPAYVAETSSAE